MLSFYTYTPADTFLYLLDSNLSNYRLLPLCLFRNEHSAFMGFAIIKALPSLYWDSKNDKCFTHVSWIAVGSLWPITEPSSTEFTVYVVFFTVQGRLLYPTELLIIRKLNLLHTVKFPNAGVTQECEEFPTIAGIAIRGPATTESRTGSLETHTAGFSLLALHGKRGSKTTDHTSLRGLRQMENKHKRQNNVETNSSTTLPPVLGNSSVLISYP